MKKEPLIFIEHILESISRIESFSKNLPKEKFLKDELRQSAIIKKSRVSPHLKRCGLFGFLDTQDSPHTKVCGFPRILV